MIVNDFCMFFNRFDLCFIVFNVFFDYSQGFLGLFFVWRFTGIGTGSPIGPIGPLNPHGILDAPRALLKR